MKRRMKEMIRKVKSILIEEEYAHAADIGKKCKLSAGSVCRIIRIMREDGIGVHTTKNGYTLSQFANVKDDVGFLRRLHGRRTSDYVALNAAKPHIQKRWRTVPQQRALQAICGPLRVNVRSLSVGMKVLVAKEKSLEL